MALFRKFECRVLILNGIRTSIALEPQFWEAVDRLSDTQNIKWQSWVASKLYKDYKTRASVLRVAVLEALSR